MKFRLRLLLTAFAVSFVLVAMLSLISLLRFSQLTTQGSWVEHTYNVRELITTLESGSRALDDAEFRFLATRDSSYRLQFIESLKKIADDTRRLKALISDNQAQTATLILFQSDVQLYSKAADSLMRMPISNDSAIREASEGFSEIFIGSAQAHLHQMATEEQKLLKKRTTDRDYSRQITASMLKALTIVFELFTIALFYLLLHEFRQRFRYQTALHEKVDELAQSKRELEHIAYATSHDLQEPLRKIRIFTDRLQYQSRGSLSTETADTMQRIVTSATQMQELVRGLMVLSSLSGEEHMQPCPLRKYVLGAFEKLAQQANQSDATLDVKELPAVSGIPEQLLLLFEKLLDNAMKFAQPGVAPVIHITTLRGTGSEIGLSAGANREYHCITVQDNGLGFENNSADKLFGIFRQLHVGQDGNNGRGMGLAICQRIMNNHKGRITAHGFPGVGATFKLYFPVQP